MLKVVGLFTLLLSHMTISFAAWYLPYSFDQLILIYNEIEHPENAWLFEPARKFKKQNVVMSYTSKYRVDMGKQGVYEFYDKELKDSGWLLYKRSHRTSDESNYFEYCKDDLYVNLWFYTELSEKNMSYYSLSVKWIDYDPPEEYKCKYMPDREVIVPTTQTPEEFERAAWMFLIFCLTIIIVWQILRRIKPQLFDDT